MQKHSELPQTCNDELRKVITDRNNIVLKRFETPTEFIVFMTHENCLTRYDSKLTIQEALKSDLIKLLDLKSIYNENTPVHFIESWLLQLNIFVNTENKLSGGQIKELAKYMYDEIFMLNMAELTLLFKRIKSGFYGVFYNRIDGTQLVQWCREYRKERSKYLISLTDKLVNENHIKELEIKVRSEERLRRKKLNFKRKSKMFWKHIKNRKDE